MPTGQYPFIDIAVHEKVRARYAAGNAMAVLSQSLDAVFWVNGAGARLLGHENLYDCLDAGLDRSTAAFRQIEAAARAVSGRNTVHSFVMRAGTGFRRPLTAAQMEPIALADGTPALLVATEQDEADTTLDERAMNLLDGFQGTDTHAAALGAGGTIICETASFARLGMSGATRGQIAAEVAQGADRLAKHPVETEIGNLPSAIARICDDPDLYLLFTVEMPTRTGVDPQRPSKAPEDEGSVAARSDGPPPARAARRQPIQTVTPSVLNMDPQDTTEPEKAEAEKTKTDQTSDETETETNPAEKKAAETPAVSKIITRVQASAGRGSDAPEQDNEPPFVFDPERRPTRFVWKIDAVGTFQEISREFAETVGPNAADVEGRKFSDVAQVFNIDPDHTIAALLGKRDTWSGKTVFWPVQGTDLQVPVDLAALPTYSREREFDGFRGFGIVRPADATSDPEQIGMALIDNSSLSLNHLAARPTQDDRPADVFAPGDDAGPSVTGDAPSEDGKKDDDGLSDEGPALEITDTPGRRHADKVIRLEERRTRSRDGLSKNEKQAFREIAERLGGEEAETEAEDDETQQPFGKRKTPPAPDNGDADEVAKADPEIDAARDDIEDEAELADLPDDETAEAEEAIDDGRQERRGSVVTPELLEQLPTPIIIHDGKTIFYINEEFRQLTGYLTKTELNEAGGMPALFDDSIGNPKELTVSRDGGTGLVGSHGERIDVRAKLRSVGWEAGHALMLALEPLLQESTDEETQEADETAETATETMPASKLQVEVDELRSILETATDGVVLIGQDGIIRSMNNSAAALFDYDENETTGRPFAMLFAHESQRAVKDYLSGLTGNGVASVLNDGREVIGREASGGFLPLFMTIGHLSGSNGYCAVMRDITHWKRAEEELRTAKREAETANSHKSEFLARVSHEIRTPLNAIIGFSELMAEERFGPIGSRRYVEYAHDIGRSGKHVLEIVNDLLDISKIEAGEQELEFGAVALNDALMDAISILQPQANTQRVILRTSLSSSVPDVVADKRSIKQIAINLLSNAIRYTPSGGQVVISTTYEPSGNVSLRIRDTGVGMTRFQLEQAMKPFKQVPGFERSRGEGTGLGLPLAKAMAEANRAQFAMNSQPGQGTLVEIVFPSQRVLAE